jgi:hypothetical protein
MGVGGLGGVGATGSVVGGCGADGGSTCDFGASIEGIGEEDPVNVVSRIQTPSGAAGKVLVRGIGSSASHKSNTNKP